MSRAPEAAQANPSKEAHLRDYWKIVWQGRWTVLAIFLAVVAATAAWSFLQTPIFRATATVEVQPQARRLAPGQDVSGIGMSGYGWFAEERYQNTQIEILRSRAVLEQAFEQLRLASDPRFSEAKDPISAFRAYIVVNPRRETGLVEISVELPDGAEASRWANAVARSYVQRNLERAQDNAKLAVDQIGKLMDPLRASLEGAEKQRLKVLESTEIYNPESQQAVVRQRLEQLNKEFSETQIQVASQGALLARIRDLQKNSGDPTTIPELSRDPELQELNRQRTDVEKDFEAAKVTYRPGATQYQEKESQLERVKVRIRDRIAAKLGEIQNDYDLKVRKASDLRADIRKAEDEAFQLMLATSQYNVAKIDSDTKQQVFDAINRTMQEVSLSAQLITNNVTVLDDAVPPPFPVRPKKKLNVVLGAMIGLFLGIGAVFFLDYLDNSFRSPEDVEQRLGLTTLAVVPKHAEAQIGSHAVKEAFQTLRTSLIFSSANRQKRIVLVTSTAPQEGKSSTVASLARTLAGAGERVAVIDCDLRRPTQHVHFSLPRDGGLTNYLAADGDGDERAAYLKPAGPTLRVITAGPTPPNPPELLGSDRFRSLLDHLRREFDWILIDSPPAVSLSDATLLSSIADMVVLVVRHNFTERDLVGRTVHLFRNVDAKIAGVVLNRVDLDRAYRRDYYYAGYYYYGSGEESGARDGPPKEREKVGTGA